MEILIGLNVSIKTNFKHTIWCYRY